MQSYNRSAWQHPRPPHHSTSIDTPSAQLNDASARPRHSSLSQVSYRAPQRSPSVQSPIPQSLTPGRQSARIWDMSAAQSRMASPHQSPQRPSLYNDYFSHPLPPIPSAPPIPQKPQALVNPLPNRPPIPPKPPALTFNPAPRNPLYPTSIPMPVATLPPKPLEPVVVERKPSLDEKQYELALALSASEARNREEALMAQEEEELARALEESRLLNSAYPLDDEPPPSTTSLKPPSVDRASTSAIKASAHPLEGESWLHMITPTASSSSQFSSMTDDLTSPLSVVNTNEVEQASNDYSRSTSSEVQSLQVTRDTSSITPPLYANVVSNLVRKPLPLPSSSTIPSLTSPAGSTITYPQSDYTLPSSDRASLSSAQSCSNEQPSMPSFSTKTSWTSATSESSMSNGRSLGSELALTIPEHRFPSQAPSSPNLSLASSASLEPLGEDSEDELDKEAGALNSSSSRPAAPLSANQYVEPEMLLGVSLGFSPPAISTELVPMAGAMPNVITLPYGKAPLFHFQAASWRRLLKLLARLSGTRLEPTIDALSVAKHELKLRTVIQFVKVHHSANEWRTILYFSTDHPVPSNTFAHRYTNGDVGVLPYSYTLSPLPTLLRDSAESPMAKYYVVPSTPTTPYPNLPIDFPNLAMYLQSAVQDSRRAASDSSSGLRKLAQYIDTCFQNEVETSAPTDQAASRRGVGGMFKRVIGRNKGSNKNSRGNEEIYDLVTPFVPDEWG